MTYQRHVDICKLIMYLPKKSVLFISIFAEACIECVEVDLHQLLIFVFIDSYSSYFLQTILLQSFLRRRGCELPYDPPSVVADHHDILQKRSNASSNKRRVSTSKSLVGSSSMMRLPPLCSNLAK